VWLGAGGAVEPVARGMLSPPAYRSLQPCSRSLPVFPLPPALVAAEHASNVIAIAVFFMAKALAASVPLAHPLRRVWLTSPPRRRLNDLLTITSLLC
jgi:hypothetical protein